MTSQQVDFDEELELSPWDRAAGDDGLLISRRDIEFFNVAPERVAINIRVTNTADRPSAAAMVTLQAAPFGAFVPWQPLTELGVPALALGEVFNLRTMVKAGRSQPLGQADRVPPRQLLTALGLADDGERSRQPTVPGTLPLDLMQLLTQETPHWVGNLNVMVGNTNVERHQALALRVYPNRLNTAWFFVGSPGKDAYAFRLSGCTDWDVKLFDMTARESLVLNTSQDQAIAPERWIPTTNTRMMLLAMCPPSNCGAGSIEVHVCQQSSGKEAVVEFSLDPSAAGKGCYVL